MQATNILSIAYSVYHAVTHLSMIRRDLAVLMVTRSIHRQGCKLQRLEQEFSNGTLIKGVCVRVESVVGWVQGMITGLSLPETGEQRLMNFTLARPNAPGQGKLSVSDSLVSSNSYPRPACMHTHCRVPWQAPMTWQQCLMSLFGMMVCTLLF